MLRYFPHWNAFWIYSDEGFNVMKGLLVGRGYALYSQIWSDQPPLFTYLLALLYRWNGESIYTSRLLVLLFSCLLIWGFVQYLRLAWGNAAALAGAILVVLLPHFPTLSAAALVGQPSLAMAMVSMLALASWHTRQKRAFLALSAVALGISLLFKLYTAFLAPVFVIGLVTSEYILSDKQRSGWHKLNPALVWSLTFLIFTVLAGVIAVGPGNIPQLILPHFAASQANLSGETQIYPITFYLRDSWSILLLALVGIGCAFQQRRWLMFYPIAWMASAVLILLNMRPVWFHHQLLITLPAALLAGGAAAETLLLLYRAIRTPSTLGKAWIGLASGLIAILLVLANRPAQAISQFEMPGASANEPRAPFEDRVMRKINLYSERTNWMVTDLPMFAFRAGIAVPPNLAVISGKRFASGELTEENIIETVREYTPEQVLIGRFKLPRLEQSMLENYALILEREQELKLYIRKDLLR
jgi:4-amino-4-deoxy-L-arabinose transferase-like glycosyltransferase